MIDVATIRPGAYLVEDSTGEIVRLEDGAIFYVAADLPLPYSGIRLTVDHLRKLSFFERQPGRWKLNIAERDPLSIYHEGKIFRVEYDDRSASEADEVLRYVHELQRKYYDMLGFALFFNGAFEDK